jgi:hypothetical protein
LRDVARAKGVLSGAVCAVGRGASAWTSIHGRAADEFAAANGRITLAAVRAWGAIATDVPVEGEYEVRAKLVREGESFRSSMWGVVFSGARANDWLVFGVNGAGAGFVKWLATSNGGNPVERPLRLPGSFEPPIAADEELDIAVHVLPSGRAEIRVGKREPVSLELPRALPASGFVGVYAKDAQLTVEDLVVELFP